MKRWSIAFALWCCCLICTGQAQVTALTTENLVNPIGLDRAPRFSWQLTSPKRNTMQSAYEIRVSNQATMKSILWSTGKITSDQARHIAYGGPGLQPAKRYYWQVRVWDNSGKASPWSAAAFWETGLMDASRWTAQWISSGLANDQVGAPPPMLRKEFQLKKPVASARVYVTAHGLYEGWINGKRMGDAYLTPGWTSYNKRLQYQVYDVTSLLKTGGNAIGVQLADGWYRGHLGWQDSKNLYGRDASLLLQMEVTYADGTKETVNTDNTWKSSYGPVRMAEIYHGEWYDAQMEKTGWTMPGYKEDGWQPAHAEHFGLGNIVASESQPIRKQEKIKAVKVFQTPKGETVIDFGQNLVGWVGMKVSGKAGDQVKIHHAEVLDKEGNFYLDNLRLAKAEVVYTLKGGGEEIFEPTLSFFGFRFIRIEGYPGKVLPENFWGVVIHSDLKNTGNFSCSNDLLNQLQHNIQWGQKGNFLDVPTDCPQRDERMGWTGDAQAFYRTAAYNMDVEQFFAKWLKDLAADQREDGAIPFVIPNVLGKDAAQSAGWADAGTIIPWQVYLTYGDRQVLATQYKSMKDWVGYMEKNSQNYLWNKGFHFGDWLFYSLDDDPDGKSAVTDKYLIAQCFFAHSTQLLINAARVLGENDDAQRYEALLKNVKDAFLKEYVTPNGRLVSSTQTAYVLALYADMLPETMRPAAAKALADNVRAYNNHITTGFLGTPYICHVLTRYGYDDVAYTLLMQETYPSWLYPVKMGATTIWERWDGIKPNGTFQTAGMNSFNHYAYGAIGDWMYRVVTGLNTESDKPGYKHIRIQPHPGPALTFAKADFSSPYGMIRSHWKMENGKLTMDVEIPANTTAEVYVPAQAADKITEGGKPLGTIKEIQIQETAGGYVHLVLGSGSYQFNVNP